MIFILKIRPVTENDLSYSTLFLPEADDYDMYLGALYEAIEQIGGIKLITQNGSSFSIETTQPFSEAELKILIKPVFTEDIMKHLRFVSLIKS